MSKITKQLEIDIMRFFDDIENQNHADKIQTLRNLFTKYLHLNSCDFQMNGYNFHDIISGAKQIFSDKKMPINLEDRRIVLTQEELRNICIIESAISHFNKNACLNKIPKFKYTNK